jgi:hypothetical protein
VPSSVDVRNGDNDVHANLVKADSSSTRRP